MRIIYFFRCHFGCCVLDFWVHMLCSAAWFQKHERNKTYSISSMQTKGMRCIENNMTKKKQTWHETNQIYRIVPQTTANKSKSSMAMFLYLNSITHMNTPKRSEFEWKYPLSLPPNRREREKIDGRKCFLTREQAERKNEIKYLNVPSLLHFISQGYSNIIRTHTSIIHDLFSGNYRRHGEVLHKDFIWKSMSTYSRIAFSSMMTRAIDMLARVGVNILFTFFSVRWNCCWLRSQRTVFETFC